MTLYHTELFYLERVRRKPVAVVRYLRPWEQAYDYTANSYDAQRMAALEAHGCAKCGQETVTCGTHEGIAWVYRITPQGEAWLREAEEKRRGERFVAG